MYNIILSNYLGILLKILPYLLVSLLATFFFVKIRKNILFYIMIAIEIIYTFVKLYGFITLSIVQYQAINNNFLIFNLCITLLIYLLVPLCSLLFKLIIQKIEHKKAVGH